MRFAAVSEDNTAKRCADACVFCDSEVARNLMRLQPVFALARVGDEGHAQRSSPLHRLADDGRHAVALRAEHVDYHFVVHERIPSSRNRRSISIIASFIMSAALP